jgi:hypothetical protein
VTSELRLPETDSASQIWGGDPEEADKTDDSSVQMEKRSQSSSDDEHELSENEKKKKKGTQALSESSIEDAREAEETTESEAMKVDSSVNPTASQVKTKLVSESPSLASASVGMSEGYTNPAWATKWELRIDNVLIELSLCDAADLGVFFASKVITEEDLKRLVDQIEVQVAVVTSDHVKGNTPDDSVNLYWCITQSTWMQTDSLSLNEASNWADFKADGTRESMAQCVGAAAKEGGTLKEELLADVERIQAHREDKVTLGRLDHAWRVFSHIGEAKLA